MRGSPPDIWRPSLPLARALDRCFSVERSPAAMLNPPSIELLAACLNRCPDLAILGDALPPLPDGTLEVLAGYHGAYQSLENTAQHSFRLVIVAWHSLARRPAQLIARWLCPGGTLAILIIPPLPWQPIASDVLMARRFVRRCSCRIEITEGYLGPQAVAWSAGGYLARRRGNLQAYDYCHAMMRATLRNDWPAALLSRSAVVIGRKLA
ncbi:MAG: hypothetical protein M1396_04970 [Chloroflexi bacterium]|nr:hypothetical protein [Chloroflexota bacterium]